jgi:beta-galactosidase
MDSRVVEVPGIINVRRRWLKREVVLPGGNWETVSLLFKGARYNPAVYVNGDKVSFREGGMGPRTHYVEHADLRPGNKVTLEVELMSLADMSEDNASYTPIADHWRSSISAYLWDDVVLQFHRGVAINRMIPFTDIHEDKVDVHVFPKFLQDEIKGGTIRATLSQGGTS